MPTGAGSRTVRFVWLIVLVAAVGAFVGAYAGARRSAPAIPSRPETSPLQPLDAAAAPIPRRLRKRYVGPGLVSLSDTRPTGGCTGGPSPGSPRHANCWSSAHSRSGKRPDPNCTPKTAIGELPPGGALLFLLEQVPRESGSGARRFFGGRPDRFHLEHLDAQPLECFGMSRAVEFRTHGREIYLLGYFGPRATRLTLQLADRTLDSLSVSVRRAHPRRALEGVRAVPEADDEVVMLMSPVRSDAASSRPPSDLAAAHVSGATVKERSSSAVEAAAGPR